MNTINEAMKNLQTIKNLKESSNNEFKLQEKLNNQELVTYSKAFLNAETEEDLSRLAKEIYTYSEPTYRRIIEIINGEGTVPYKGQQISDILYQLNDPKGLIENKIVKEDYTAREEFDAGLKKYLANGENRSADDIKVVAETDNYLLSASRSEDNPDRIYLNVFSGSERSINVYIDQDYKGKVEKAEVNWSAIGSVSPDEAEAYCKKLMDAVEFAREIDGKDYSSEV